jgi:hypothetical protein
MRQKQLANFNSNANCIKKSNRIFFSNPVQNVTLTKIVFVSIGAKSSSIGKKNMKKTKKFLSKDLGDGLGKYFYYIKLL